VPSGSARKSTKAKCEGVTSTHRSPFPKGSFCLTRDGFFLKEICHTGLGPTNQFSARPSACVPERGARDPLRNSGTSRRRTPSRRCQPGQKSCRRRLQGGIFHGLGFVDFEPSFRRWVGFPHRRMREPALPIAFPHLRTGLRRGPLTRMRRSLALFQFRDRHFDQVHLGCGEPCPGLLRPKMEGVPYRKRTKRLAPSSFFLDTRFRYITRTSGPE
jgi:hypothetical protein